MIANNFPLSIYKLIMDLFQSHYLFNNLSLHQIQILIQKSRLINCVKDQVIFKEGSFVDTRSSSKRKESSSHQMNHDQKFYFVKQGHFKLVKKTETKFFQSRQSPEDNFKQYSPKNFNIDDLSSLLLPDVVKKQGDSVDKYSLPRRVEVILITTGSVVGLAEIISRETRRKYFN